MQACQLPAPVFVPPLQLDLIKARAVRQQAFGTAERDIGAGMPARAVGRVEAALAQGCQHGNLPVAQEHQAHGLLGPLAVLAGMCLELIMQLLQHGLGTALLQVVLQLRDGLFQLRQAIILPAAAEQPGQTEQYGQAGMTYQ